MKKSLKQKDILLPAPSALVVSGDEDNANIITVAWIGIMSSKPPSLAISLKDSRYSLELIKKNREFTVNIPKTEHYKETDLCGIANGKQVDKFERTGFTKSKSIWLNTPIIKECPLNLECKTSHEIDMGDWTMIIAEILEVQLDSDCISSDGGILTEKIDPLVYIPTIREYWTLGEKLGDSFKCGVELL